jgi:hypothetical protein
LDDLVISSFVSGPGVIAAGVFMRRSERSRELEMHEAARG